MLEKFERFRTVPWRAKKAFLSVDVRRSGDARIVMLGQEVGELLVRRFVEGSLLPQVGRQVRVRLGDG